MKEINMSRKIRENKIKKRIQNKELEEEIFDESELSFKENITLKQELKMTLKQQEEVIVQ
jgi:hypothetical protein